MSNLPKATVFKSTNFTLQSIIPLVVAIAALFGFTPDDTLEITGFVEATIVAIVGFWGFIREQLKGAKAQWNSNVLTYIVAFFAGFFPWLSNYNIEGAVGGLIDALGGGDFSVILAALFAVGNIIYKIVQDRRSANEPAPSA